MENIAKELSDDVKQSFHQHLKEYNKIASLFEAINACEHKMMGHTKKEVMLVDQPKEENDDRLCRQYQLFHNLSLLFMMNNDHVNALFASTYWDIFRHAYNELNDEFIAFVDNFINTLVNHKNDIVPTNLSNQVYSKNYCVDHTRCG